ncbi:hypothetical protein EOM89_11175 [Candidatus Falkowbacteria bacterium]|nr:hypothetical protein [Candidatus Falkowbacteria bacterium]
MMVLDGGWRLVSFADPLRALALELHPEWCLLDLQGPKKDCPRPATWMGWGRVEDIVIRHAQDLAGEAVVERYPQVLADAVSGLQSALSPRGTLRLLGDCIRAVDPDALVLRAAERVEAAMRAGESAVIDDVRFEPEAAMVRAYGGFVVHVRRAGVSFRRDHNSEQGVAFVADDLALVNRGELNGLRGELVSVLRPGYRMRGATA